MKLTLTIESLEQESEEAEKLCHKCGEYWPKTDEFFPRCVEGYLYSPCKACNEEQRRARNAVEPCCIPGCSNPRHAYYTSRCYEHRYHAMKKVANVAAKD